MAADFIIPFVILFASTVLFWIFPFDIEFQKLFYRSDYGWFLKDSFPWKFLYHYGNLPALVLSVGSLVLLGMSFWKKSLVKYRKIFLYFVLIMAIGPGLLINSILKDNWGRPRPRNIVEFDGNYQYEKPLQIDLNSSGKSFPCGHASMGFYLIAPFFVLRKKKKATAYSFLVSGITSGGLIGFARIIQGGHFASDVIWAGGIVYLVSAGFYYLLKLDKRLFFIHQKEPASRQKVIIVSIIGLAVIALILLILMASPYSYSKTFQLEQFKNYDTIKVAVHRGEVGLIESNENKIVLSATGHGFPWSKLKTKLKQEENLLILRQRESGYFSEIVQSITIGISNDSKTNFQVTIKEGNIIIDKDMEIDLEANLKNGNILRK